MEVFETGLLLFSAVLLSAMLDKIVPKVSMPLIQIAIGVLLALVVHPDDQILLDPQIFMVLIIAPLIYDESKRLDKLALWRERSPIFSLAVGLVVVTTLVAGFATNLLIPSIPLVAAFAFGAALSPTDAVAVTSLAKEIDIPDRQKTILENESLLNDATGIVTFQFALAAAVTGAFSVVGASVEFLFQFVGGLIVGAALGLAGNFIVGRARSFGIQNSMFHVMFEILAPFVVYLVASALGVSGIIAVVATGLVNVIASRSMNPSISRTNVVSSSVWGVLSFTLNGVVFVLMGMQLPNAMRETWGDVTFHNGFLIVCIVLIAVVLYLVRFVWALVMERRYLRRKEGRGLTRSDVKAAVVTTLCGAKGAITLSVLLTIPYFISEEPLVAFPQRELIIFLACGVIVLTLVVANFVVPLISPPSPERKAEAEHRQKDVECSERILREVINELRTWQSEGDHAEVQQVIDEYEERIRRMEAEGLLEGEWLIEPIRALHWERKRAKGHVTLNDERVEHIRRSSLNIELKYINKMQGRGELSAQGAKVLKDNVRMMQIDLGNVL